MQLIFYSNKHGVIRIGRKSLIGLMFAAAAALPLLAGLGFSVADRNAGQQTDTVNAEMVTDRARLEMVQREARLHLDALATRLGTMQARLARLDAVSTQVMQSSGLGEIEFGFSSEIGQGGPESVESQPLELPDFMQELESLTQRLALRETQFSALDHLLMNRALRAEIEPSGHPIEGGWISSPFGQRTDPFSGRRTRHTGLDFANQPGTPILATATGFVRFAGRRSGYGNMVELDHGDGYRTIYGHNDELLVHIGDFVKKGFPIATLGSTGRSTGPHLHYEVLRNGQPIDPKNFLHASR
ncbi:MAG: M23 family metallopeptidase [Gammaproteobacteria bacterium]|nr:M23 family metallopeptidase [Gammaproteobacteria bacterium]